MAETTYPIFNGGQRNTGDPVSASNGAGQPAPTGTGTPLTSGTTMSSALQPTYAPTPPQAAVATVDPTAQIQQILAAFAPQAKQAGMNLNDTLAASGITGGGTVQAQDQLQQQLASALGPTLASAIGGANSENQSALNTGNEYNTSNLINTETGNVSSANQFAQLIAQLQQQQYLANQGNYTGLLQSGLSGQEGINQASTGNYTTTGGVGSALGSLGSAVGNLYGKSTPAPTTPTADPLSGDP